MEETIVKGDHMVTLFLNEDRSVKMDRMMVVTYPVHGKAITKSTYPSPEPGKKWGSIGEQFKLIASMQRLDVAFANNLSSSELRTVREKLEMNQTEFSIYLGSVSLRTVQEWESGKNKIPVTVAELLRERGRI